MIVTFITMADSFDALKDAFPDILYSEGGENISVTIEIKDGADAFKLLSAGMLYGADRIINARKVISD